MRHPDTAQARLRSGPSRSLTGLAALATATAMVLPVGLAGASSLAVTTSAAFAGVTAPVSVMVRTVPGAAADVARILGDLGASVVSYSSLDLLEVTVDAATFADLADRDDVVAVTPNASVTLSSSEFNPKDDAGFTFRIAHDVVKVNELWKKGFRGQGIDVAIIDSGVSPVAGLDAAGKLVHGPDLSFESQIPELTQLDTYGHGTHLAGLIGGADPVIKTMQDPKDATEKGAFSGMAPAARIISLKVADHNGTTDVSQVIAAIDWVVQHRNTDGMNIRVLNLSFGTESTQSYSLDPLAHAAQVAWDNGIVVVAAAGNDGNDSNGLDDPAFAPGILAVGGAGPKPGKTGAGDYVLGAYSSCGDSTRPVDILAPGTSMVSMRVPGSQADELHADTGAVTDRFFRGTGTSQAAAVVSGGIASLLSAAPGLQPDEVRALLMREAKDIDVDVRCGGAGLVNFKDAFSHTDDAAKYLVEFTEDLAKARQARDEKLAKGDAPDQDDLDTIELLSWIDAADPTGLGSLQASRGEIAVVDADGVVLEGELDIFGQPWDAEARTKKSKDGKGWEDGDWNGSTWAGSNWQGSNWQGSNWQGSTWAGSNWQGSNWQGSNWQGSTWAGNGWSGSNWQGSNWQGSNWQGSNWQGSNWQDWFWASNAWSTTQWS